MYKTNKLISNGIVTTTLLLIFSFSPSVFYHKYLIVMKECKLPEVTALFMTVVKKCDILKVRAIKNKGINSQADGTHAPLLCYIWKYCHENSPSISLYCFGYFGYTFSDYEILSAVRVAQIFLY